MMDRSDSAPKGVDRHQAPTEVDKQDLGTAVLDPDTLAGLGTDNSRLVAKILRPPQTVKEDVLERIEQGVFPESEALQFLRAVSNIPPRELLHNPTAVDDALGNFLTDAHTDSLLPEESLSEATEYTGPQPTSAGPRLHSAPEILRDAVKLQRVPATQVVESLLNRDDGDKVWVHIRNELSQYPEESANADVVRMAENPF